MTKFEFPFKHFNTGVIFNGEAMTTHDPCALVLFSGRESRMIIRKELIAIDNAINTRMDFSALLDSDDVTKEQAVNAAQALAAIRNKLWFATNPNQEIPDFNDGDADKILWQHGTWDFDNTPLIFSMDVKGVKPKKEVESDDYLPRKVLSVTTHSRTSRGIRLTVEMTAYNITLMWTANTWNISSMNKQDFRLSFEAGVHWKRLESHFPKETAERICSVYAMFQKSIIDKFSDLTFKMYC